MAKYFPHTENMGRPKVANPKTISIGVRLTQEQYDKLKAYSKESGKTITEIVIAGLKPVIGD